MVVTLEHENKIIIKDKNGNSPLNVVSFNTHSKLAEIYMEIEFVHPEHGIGKAMQNVVTTLKDFDAYDKETGKIVED